MVAHTHLRVACRRVGMGRIDELVAMEENCFETDRLVRRNLRHLLRSPSVACIGAFCGGDLVGNTILLFRCGSRVARIYSLAVVPAARGRGIARRLLAKAEQAARERGCNRFRLEVRQDNKSAIQLYRRNGFADAGVTPGFYEDGADALVMRKELG